ncbi:SDR family oxidoreductase [Candidatus Nitrosocosmicus franklandus]|uniref:Short-chain dehydrogenase/reductase SDR n=1 Tax=Candidatus Nitrosocosmicus franklandianus TaxID=1798806 RepID=A0A484IEH9_9ARCH|nr:SDR family oxidoreductase [Candidatus Nitrosocosmicus franklandus]VFJ15227.1 Short-chain dehydrogenase/reductase SDR [Candidatus Nitrosocosmicus franklandus]
MDRQKVVIVTGSSSGIGLETSILLARSGYTTYATMRDIDKAKPLREIAINESLPLTIIQLDVTKENSVSNAIESITKSSGRIDILVNNARYGLTGAFEDLEIDEIKSLYETNFFGLIRTTQSVLPVMRQQKSGIIVNISSGLGRFGIATSSAYSSSKFAIEGLTESMSYELEAFGIRTIIVEPGIIKTNFLKSSKLARKATDPNSPYRNFIQNMEKGMKNLIENGQDPRFVAEIILKAIEDPIPRIRYLAGKDVEQIMQIKSKLSDEDFHIMLKKMANLK